jgi:hypothetical protein
MRLQDTALQDTALQDTALQDTASRGTVLCAYPAAAIRHRASQNHHFHWSGAGNRSWWVEFSDKFVAEAKISVHQQNHEEYV